MPHGTRLPRYPATLGGDENIELRFRIRELHRLHNVVTQRLASEVIIQLTLVDLPFAVAGYQAHTRDCCLAATCRR